MRVPDKIDPTNPYAEDEAHTKTSVIKIPVTVVEVYLPCVSCGEGTLEYKPDNAIRSSVTTLPATRLIEHKCTACGITTYLTRSYPHRDYEPQENIKDILDAKKGEQDKFTVAILAVKKYHDELKSVKDDPTIYPRFITKEQGRAILDLVLSELVPSSEPNKLIHEALIEIADLEIKRHSTVLTDMDERSKINFALSLLNDSYLRGRDVGEDRRHDRVTVYGFRGIPNGSICKVEGGGNKMQVRLFQNGLIVGIINTSSSGQALIGVFPPYEVEIA